jgi:hypothetical protein
VSGTDAEECGQTERGFIKSSEFARASLQDAGYSVDRTYNRHGDPYSPTWYADSSLLPEEIGYGSLFPWNSDTDDIVDAINEGRFLVTHRDHGEIAGWSHPSFFYYRVADLDNDDLQPVVFSINCLSGNEVFVDRLLVQDRYDPTASTGGAVGVIAATRITYSGINDALYRGLIDSIWPEALPDYGDPTDPPRVLGDMLLYAKLYASSTYDPVRRPAVADDYYMQATIQGYHAWGDPTLQMWTKEPIIIPEFFLLESNDTASLTISYAENGAVITAYQETDDGHYPLGRSSVIDGKATISYLQSTLVNVPILLSVAKANTVGLLLTPALTVGSEAIAFGTATTETGLTLTNTGGGVLSWSLSALPDWLSVSSPQGELAADETTSLSVPVDRSGLADGSYAYNLTFTSNVLNAESATKTVAVTMTVTSDVSLLTLIKTGVTESYDEDGNLVTGLMDDGYYQYGQDFSYTANLDGTVTDQVTGLRWLQNGSAVLYNYADAQTYCSGQSLDGGGWRIPNVYEYYTILNFSQDNPALEHSFFTSIAGYYWTATQMANSTLYVWSIREPYADDGIYTSKSGLYYVRCVKGEELEPPATGRFVDNGSGTVLDNWTGLVWEATSSNGTTGYSWQEAISHCEAKTTLGRSWHLPNVKQMQSLLPKDMEGPARDSAFFFGDSATLWTSTTDMYTNGFDKDLAWAADEGAYGDFVLGGVHKYRNEDDYGYPMGARCVSW